MPEPRRGHATATTQPYGPVAATRAERPLDERVALEYLAHLYLEVMGGRPRRDTPETRIKYTRDFEYPWVLLQARPGPNVRMLDCGSGNSPLPFACAALGASVTALDRDSVVASRLRYLLTAAKWLAWDLLRMPFGIVRRYGGWSSMVRENRLRLSRVTRPDFWGPVSPKLLRRYGVDYVKGDMTRLQFPSDHFDVVTCVSVLEHLPVELQGKALASMARVVRRGGRLVLTYDKVRHDQTAEFVDASGLRLAEARYLQLPPEMGKPDVIALSLVKE